MKAIRIIILVSCLFFFSACSFNDKYQSDTQSWDVQTLLSKDAVLQYCSTYGIMTGYDVYSQVSPWTLDPYELKVKEKVPISWNEVKKSYGGVNEIEEFKKKSVGQLNRQFAGYNPLVGDGSCEEFSNMFVYTYTTGNVKLYVDDYFSDKILKLYRFEMPIDERSIRNPWNFKFNKELPLSNDDFLHLASCSITNEWLAKIRKDGSFFSFDDPSRFFLGAVDRNNTDIVRFEMEEGLYSNIWTLYFGKNFNLLFKQGKAEFFFLGEKSRNEECLNCKYCNTLYSTNSLESVRSQYYQRIVFWTEKDPHYYYLLEYSFPTDRPQSTYWTFCPPPVFIDIQE